MLTELKDHMCQVPAGDYPLGHDRSVVSRPEHLVTLAAYEIGLTTVTNAVYALFIEGGGYTESAHWTEIGWRWRSGKDIRAPGFWSDTRYNRPQQPVVGVTWYEAYAFTRWLAAETEIAWRLPTEPEWEAAALGTERRAPLPRNYNTLEQGRGRAWEVTEAGNTSWCGAQDLCGNVWEWCSTRWGRNWNWCDYLYPYDKGDNRENPEEGHTRIMRGGSWFDPLQEAVPTMRGRYAPGSRASNIGFRLARDTLEKHNTE
jgi:formylglycine-generating enzyme required for sulfatase activity